MTFGEKLKQLRDERGWSQYKLAQKTGIARATIASWENDRSLPKGEMLLKLAGAGAFNIPVEELYEAAGYTTGVQSMRRVETAEELLERARLAQPMSIPVYTEFRPHAGVTHEEPVEYIYRMRPKEAKRNIEAYMVYGSCLEPIISEGDVVIVDRDLPGEPGDEVLCLIDDKLVIGRLKAKDNEVWVENGEDIVKLGDCRASAVVIEVIKRRK